MLCFAEGCSGYSIIILNECQFRYLCRKICENLGHGIRAESDPESGTVIRLDLRREKLETE